MEGQWNDERMSNGTSVIGQVNGGGAESKGEKVALRGYEGTNGVPLRGRVMGRGHL